MSESRSIASLDWRGGNGGAGGDLVLRRASVLDPRAGIDGTYDVVVRGGEIAELADPGSAEPESLGAGDVELIEAEGKAVFPAFFDPHVHLRTPGDEDEEDIETGTRAAAAGGYCGILAMANTQPPVQTAADVRALRERAADEASRPGGIPCLRHPGHGGRGADRDGRVARRRGRRVLGRRPADLQRARAATRASVPASGRSPDRAPRGGPRPLPACRAAPAAARRRDARGTGLGRPRPGRHPLDRRVDDDRP